MLSQKDQQRRRQHVQLAGGVQIRAASFSPLRNVAIKKEKEEKAKKRKSMTLDTAGQHLGSKNNKNVNFINPFLIFAI